MHVVTTRRHYKETVYETTLLRRSYREGGKVRNQTLANLSHLPPELIELIRRHLRGEALAIAGEDFEVARSLPHGHVAAVAAVASRLGFPALLGPACPERDLAFALVVARVCRPGSKLATTRWWADTTLAADLGVAGASTDDVYGAMDWLVGRQGAIEAALARRHLAPGGFVLFDLSSSWVEAATARSPPGASPATTRATRPRSSTASSPTPRVAPWRSRSSPATPPTPPPSSRPPRRCVPASGPRPTSPAGFRTSSTGTDTSLSTRRRGTSASSGPPSRRPT